MTKSKDLELNMYKRNLILAEGAMDDFNEKVFVYKMPKSYYELVRSNLIQTKAMFADEILKPIYFGGEKGAMKRNAIQKAYTETTDFYRNSILRIEHWLPVINDQIEKAKVKREPTINLFNPLCKTDLIEAEDKFFKGIEGDDLKKKADKIKPILKIAAFVKVMFEMGWFDKKSSVPDWRETCKAFAKKRYGIKIDTQYNRGKEKKSALQKHINFVQHCFEKKKKSNLERYGVPSST